MGEDFSGSRAVTSRTPLIHIGATNSTKSPRFGAEGLQHGLSSRAWRCVEEPFATVNFREPPFHVPNLAIKCATYRRSNDGRKSCLLEPPITRKPRRYQADVDQVARFICHANSTHVLQSLWRGLRRSQGVILQASSDPSGKRVEKEESPCRSHTATLR